MNEMKWKSLLVASSIVGAFSVGAMFNSIGESSATQNDIASTKMPSIIQTADEQTDASEELESPPCHTQGNGMGGMMGMGHHGSAMMSTVIADALGMTMEDFQAARTNGKSVADLAKEKGVKVDELVALMIKSKKEKLEQYVKDGSMTQEQMDAMLEQAEAMMKDAIEGNFVGPMHGNGKEMMKGHGGNWSDTAEQIRF